jgi:hypothetical protein
MSSSAPHNNRKPINRDLRPKPDSSQASSTDPKIKLLDRFNAFFQDRRVESTKIQSTAQIVKTQTAVQSPKNAKLIEERLCSSRKKIRLCKAYNGIIAGRDNLEAADSLKNQGNVKRLLR